MPTTTTQRVAAEIRAGLARRGLTQGDLAAALGLSQAAVSRRLTGEVPIDVEELTAVADWLGVPLSALLAEPGAA